MPEIQLSGLDGGNLLAFLAALGTLRVLTHVEPEADVRMNWLESGSWRPVVQHSRIGVADGLIERVAQHVCGESSINEAWRIGEDLTINRVEFRKPLETDAQEETPD